MSDKRKCPKCKTEYLGWAYINGSDYCEYCRDEIKFKAKQHKVRRVDGTDSKGNTFNNTIFNFGTIINRRD